jgi:hypothetical protein
MNLTVQGRRAAMTDLRVGAIVVHRQRPEWGPGKVFNVYANYALIGFRDLPEDARFIRLQWPGHIELADQPGGDVLASLTIESDATCHPVLPPVRKTRAKKRTA